MTEAEWNAWTDPRPMLEFLCDKTSDRKLRLFAVACLRQVWDLIPDLVSREAIEAAEHFADDRIGRADLDAVRYRARSGSIAAVAVGRRDVQDAVYCAYLGARDAFRPGWRDTMQPDNGCRDQSALLRCIVGPLLFRPVTIDSHALVATITLLAQAIYTDRAFDRLPILADALEDVGCHDADIIAHCRGPGPHVRGCWVVDLLLGRT